MKPTSTSTFEHRLARHDRRARGFRTVPITDYFFRPQTDTGAGRAQGRSPGLSSKRAFRRMMATMMTKKDRPHPLEIVVSSLVVGIIGWSVIELVITLSQTGYGW